MSITKLAYRGVLVLTFAMSCKPVEAQQPRAQPQSPAKTLTFLLAEGFEIKGTLSPGGIVVQKGKDVFLCALENVTVKPLSFGSECGPVT